MSSTAIAPTRRSDYMKCPKATHFNFDINDKSHYFFSELEDALDVARGFRKPGKDLIEGWDAVVVGKFRDQEGYVQYIPFYGSKRGYNNLIAAKKAASRQKEKELLIFEILDVIFVTFIETSF